MRFYTSNFANNKLHDLNGISISRYPAIRQGFKGPEFTPLMPSSQLLTWYKGTIQAKSAWAEYCEAYNAQLDCLKAASVYEELSVIAEAHDADEIILLCYEPAKTLDTQPCHRRLVAAWLESELGITVPEWSMGEAK